MVRDAALDRFLWGIRIGIGVGKAGWRRAQLMR